MLGLCGDVCNVLRWWSGGSVSSLSLLTLDFSWPGPAAAAAAAGTRRPLPLPPTAGVGGAGRLAEAFLPSFLPMIILPKGLEVKLAAGWLRFNSLSPGCSAGQIPREAATPRQLYGLAKPSFCLANYPAAALQKVHFDIQLAGRWVQLSRVVTLAASCDRSQAAAAEVYTGALRSTPHHTTPHHTRAEFKIQTNCCQLNDLSQTGSEINKVCREWMSGVV